MPDVLAAITQISNLQRPMVEGLGDGIAEASQAVTADGDDGDRGQDGFVQRIGRDESGHSANRWRKPMSGRAPTTGDGLAHNQVSLRRIRPAKMT